MLLGGESDAEAAVGDESDEAAACLWLDRLCKDSAETRAAVEAECRQRASELVQRTAPAIETIAGRLLEIAILPSEEAMIIFDACRGTDETAVEDLCRYILDTWRRKGNGQEKARMCLPQAFEYSKDG